MGNNGHPDDCLRPRGRRTGVVIAEECEASINREFPAQWLDKTLDEIVQAARKRDRSARKALKLLTDHRFKK
jgi:hypothetical protein